MYRYMYICICLCVYIYIYIYICTHTYTHTYVYVCVHKSLSLYIYIYIYIYHGRVVRFSSDVIHPRATFRRTAAWGVASETARSRGGVQETVFAFFHAKANHLYQRRFENPILP